MILLEQNYSRLHRVKDYARIMNKSPKTLSNKFRELGQHSPSKMIQGRIITQSKRYLMHSSLNVKEIAAKLGFVDGPTFGHFFKKHVSLTPIEFRKNWFTSTVS